MLTIIAGFLLVLWFFITGRDRARRRDAGARDSRQRMDRVDGVGSVILGTPILIDFPAQRPGRSGCSSDQPRLLGRAGAEGGRASEEALTA
ncbi:MAG: hypothetical protein ACRDLS_16470 [Solirubrobacteraceae bacterium]